MIKKREEQQDSTQQNNNLSLVERYKMVVAARNFHYENFNKWSTYFYVAIGALFIGYSTILSANELDANKKITLEYVMLLLGYIVSILWYWSSKGYYFWNINFATLINYYEETLLQLSEGERVYFVFANKQTQNNYLSPISGANISTSKVAILFAFLITTVWGFLITYKIFQFNNIFKYQAFFYIASLFLSIISILFISWILPSKLLVSKIDHYPDLMLIQEKKESPAANTA